MLGGPGVVVHIDESLFRHKPKVWYSSMASSLSDYQHFYHDILQNHRGRPPPRQVWVFGICDTSHTPARGVMRIVPDRSAATLLPIEEVIDVRTPAIIGRSYTKTKPCRYWVMPLKGRWSPPYPATEKWSSIVNLRLCKGRLTYNFGPYDNRMK